MLHFSQSLSQNWTWTGFFTKKYKSNLPLLSRFCKTVWTHFSLIGTTYKPSCPQLGFPSTLSSPWVVLRFKKALYFVLLKSHQCMISHWDENLLKHSFCEQHRKSFLKKSLSSQLSWQMTHHFLSKEVKLISFLHKLSFLFSSPINSDILKAAEKWKSSNKRWTTFFSFALEVLLPGVIWLSLSPSGHASFYLRPVSVCIPK